MKLVAPREYGSAAQLERWKEDGAGTVPSLVGVGVGLGATGASVHAAKTSSESPEPAPTRKVRRENDMFTPLYRA